VLQPAEAGAALKAELAKAGLKVKNPVVILPPAATVEMQVKLPSQVPKRDLAETVRSATSRVLGEHVGDTEIHWHPVHKAMLVQQIYVASVRRELVDSVWTMCAAAGSKPGRILPYYLSLLPLMERTEGFLLYDDTTTISALFVEHGAPAVGSRMSSADLSFAYADVWASSLISLLAGAGVDPQLATAPSFTVLTESDELFGIIQQIGYETTLYQRPADWNQSVPWPAAALAWSAAKEGPKWVRRFSLAGKRRKVNVVKPLQNALAAVLFLEAALLGYLFFIQWPGALAQMQARQQTAVQTYDSLKPQEERLTQMKKLREETQRLTNQIKGIKPATPFGWTGLYRALTAVKPAGVLLDAVTLETAPAADEKVIITTLTLSGMADSQDALSTLFTGLTREPFNSPAIFSLKQRSDTGGKYEFSVRVKHTQGVGGGD
jgi:hypothetical protein